MTKYLGNIYLSCSTILSRRIYNKIQNVNDEIVRHKSIGFIKKKHINGKNIPKKKKPSKIVNVFEKILNFNKQQKDKRLPLDLSRITPVGKVSE